MELRRSMSREDKRRCDQSIAERITSLDEYKERKTLLCYVSHGIEVDTLEIIKHALECGKAVYAPRSQTSVNIMEFYRITSFNDLEKGSFGILEPIGSDIFHNDEALCIVPALSCDVEGYRLGFGMGYYDRFLSAQSRITTICPCYESCIIPKLPSDYFDVKVNKIITDVKTIDIEV